MSEINVNISDAGLDNLPAILSLQKLAYHSEAQLLNDFTIPPMTQTLEGIIADFNDGIMLKASIPSNPDEIIGSVRGKVSQNTLFVGKLIVHPSFQNQGIGTALLSSIEQRYPGMRYELFTSEKSIKSLHIYHKNGYREFKREPLNQEFSLVFLQKS